ncbi:hypothetical protein [Radiobacillus sp. PE A8.2]|uniref:hypothetical protein n=1 Tax=Radiobacillus sp. PE A8.2 TaxID=3380349 RepID=UPI00389027D5
MKLISFLFVGMHLIGYIGMGFLFLWTEWLYLSSNFLQILNPFLHFQVIFSLITTPVFWIFVALSILGFFASAGVEKINES